VTWVTVSDAIGYTWVQRLQSGGCEFHRRSITGVDGIVARRLPSASPPLPCLRKRWEGRQSRYWSIASNEPTAPIQRLVLKVESSRARRPVL